LLFVPCCSVAVVLAGGRGFRLCLAGYLQTVFFIDENGCGFQASKKKTVCK
jgi:hypothetical protein